MKNIQGKNYSVEQAVDSLESQFLDISSRLVNTEVCDELKF